MEDSILRRSIFLSFLFLYFTSDVSAARMPRLGMQRRRPQSRAAEAMSSDEELATFYYKQTLDHFNYRPESYATFEQRYKIDFRYWDGLNSTTPIFAFLGAESSIDNDIPYIGFPIHLASHFKAMLVYIEHRFYGKSVPFGSIEKALKNGSIRGHLNSAQAIADYAQIVLHVKKMFLAETSPVIVIGGSYGGMLASWFRLKYPHVVLGALASSAPILYFDNITPQVGYYSIVSKDFKETSETCYETIRKSWAEIDKIADKPEGLSILSKRFKTCDKLNESFELTDFLDSMYTDAAQYDDPSNHPVSTICAAIDKEAKQTSDIIGQVFAGVNASLGNRSCYDVYEYGRPADITEAFSWQLCSEMVMPIGSDGGDDSMFPASPFDLNSFTNHCKTLYGVSPQPHWITTYYGGHDLKLVLHRFASNIVFSNGLRDPYSIGGVLYNISRSVVAITTAKGSHCLDIQNGKADDPDWLVMQRKSEIEIIEGWIAKYHADVLLFKQTVDAH